MNEFIPLSKLSDKWFGNPESVREDDALEEEFGLATAPIKARAELLARDRIDLQARLP